MKTLRYLPVAILLCCGGHASAQGGKLERIATLNQEATAAFESYSFRKARKKLQKALDVATGAGLLKSPKLAPTYVLMGVAYVAGSNDLYRGLHYFVRALRLNPKAKIPKQLATPQLLKMFRTAGRTVKAVGVPKRIRVRGERRTQGQDTPGPKVKGRGLVHSPIDTAKRGYPIPVKAQAGLDIQAHRLFLYYRPAGTVQFLKIAMKKTKGVFRGAIPPRATGGRYVHYYIEAVNKRGRLAGSKGSARSPNVVIIK